MLAEHFGELWVDGSVPTRAARLRLHPVAAQATVSPSLRPRHHRRGAPRGRDSYVELLDRLGPKQLVGLTATPERADGRLYDAHFPRPYVGNLRVWDAIPQPVLVPFRYFVLDVDGLDLSDASGTAVTSTPISPRSSAPRTCGSGPSEAIGERVARPDGIRALAFCVDKAHARVVADRLSREGLTARVLTDETPREERDRAKGDLTSGKVQVLCVVDLFNEGVDIPDVNTLFLFRPTESSTVFLQQLGRGLRRSRKKDILTVFDVTGRQHPNFRFDRHLRELLGHTPRELREFLETGFGRLPSGCVLQFEEHSQRDILERVKRAIPSSLDGLRSLLGAHRGEGWDLATFLRETEVDPLDLYRGKRSWTSLQIDVGLRSAITVADEAEGLKSTHKLLHVSERAAALAAMKRLVALEAHRSEPERRLAAMIFTTLYGRFEAARLDELLARWRTHAALREEIRQLLPVLEARADALPRADLLAPRIPLVLHGQYLDMELSVAFDAITKRAGMYRHFYTGHEPVVNGRYDLLLVTLDKGDVKHEHLQYADFPLGESLFQWQSQSGTRADSEDGLRHLKPAEMGVTPLLFVREAKKDARGVTSAFRYLGPVEPHAHRGERPITIEWKLGTPLLPEWVRRWGNVA